jgi:glutamine---fructose-6-phosphate transaminase (isomerizing)
MCGIVGYVGKKDCTKVLLDSLSKLEYRDPIIAKELLSA